MFRCSVLCLFLLSCVISSAFAHVHDCVTPDSKSGLCVQLNDCPQLKPLFENVTSENYVFLRRSQCGYADDQPEVCCAKTGPSKPFKINTQTPVRVPHMPIGNRFGTASRGLPEPGVCGMQTFDNRIFGGEITGIDEFPWMALLEYGIKQSNGRGFACGGALIHSRYVLTAAHCTAGADEKKLGGLMSVRLGEYNVDKDIDCDAVATSDCAPPPMDIPVVEKIVHPQYIPDTADQHHDIALLKLAQPVEFNDFVMPICLAKNISTGLFAAGKSHFVSGWGQTEKKRHSPIKLKLKIPVVTYDSCSSIYSNRFKIRLRSTQICAGGLGDMDSCRGDSGGPLMVPAKIPSVGPIWFMTGLVSIGPTPCATRNIPGIYTKVSDYYDWIVENIK